MSDYWHIEAESVLQQPDLTNEEKARLCQLHLARVSLTNDMVVWTSAYSRCLGDTDYS